MTLTADMANPPAYRMLVLGAGKSGTTALYYCMKLSAERHFGQPFAGLFEPKSQETVLAFDANRGACKILVERFRDFGDQRQVIECFDKRVLIIRDPRDNVISRLMWQVATRLKDARPEDAEAIVSALQRKEQDPKSISVFELYRIASPAVGKTDQYARGARNGSFIGYNVMKAHRDLFLLRYEDFVDHNLSEIENYLGIPLLHEFQIPGKTSRVLRTAKYGNWVNWFLDEDYEFFVEPEREKLALLGYRDERPSGFKRHISPAEISEYIDRVLNYGAEPARPAR